MAFGDEYLSVRCLSAMVCQNTAAKFLLSQECYILWGLLAAGCDVIGRKVS
ncbi:MAG: hypothetical protein COB61_007915 [Thiotrichales bacterium]|nr:hypothetical protein [Thiotrichales bacterium]